MYINGSTNTFTTAGGNLIGDNSGNPAAPNTTTFPTGNPNANGDKVGTAGSVIDPLLGPLQNNGGTTPTRALLTRSPAIDAGLNSNTFDPSNSSPLLFDQRGAGFPRIVDGDGDTVETVDIGAFEVQRAPLAAGVSISGRVMTANGRGIRNVWITLTDSSGNVRTAVTSSFGYFSFDDVSAGETYIISAFAKRYRFNQPTRVLSVNDGLADVDFTAQ